MGACQAHVSRAEHNLRVLLTEPKYSNKSFVEAHPLNIKIAFNSLEAKRLTCVRDLHKELQRRCKKLCWVITTQAKKTICITYVQVSFFLPTYKKKLGERGAWLCVSCLIARAIASVNVEISTAECLRNRSIIELRF